jgi:serine phosphatase RsbU (regulator of sigma subunit)
LLSWLNIRAKLIVVLVGVGLVPLAVLGWISVAESEVSISREVFNHLISVRDGKKAQIERFLKRTQANIRVLADSSHIDAALDAFSAVVRDGQVDEGQFNYFESLEYGASFRRFIAEYEYYDLMLINEIGDIVYSTRKENDFGQNVLTGPLKESLLGRAFERGLEEVVLTDFQIYAPSGGRVMSFVLAPIGASGATAGAVVLKMTNAALNEVMSERSGMGRTGEAYLIGPDNLMRSDTYLDPVNRNVSASFLNPAKGRIDTISSAEALAGKTGHQIILDYRGGEVLSAYLPIKFGPITFALMAEIDKNEAFKPIENLQHLVLVLALAIVALMLLSAYFIAKVATQPILSLTQASIEISGGELDQEISIAGDDELGVLSENFNKMRLSIRSKIGEIEESREALRQINETLEHRVEERTSELAHAVSQISSSIEYASNIQKAILPNTETMIGALGEHFVAWEPKDIVGGDFYWVREWGDGQLLAVGDCTGHGVPGAFMTLIATATLNRCLRTTPPGQVDELMRCMNARIKSVLRGGDGSSMSDDGMDLGLVYLPNGDGDSDGEVYFCGAGFSLFAKNAHEISEYKGYRHGIGYQSVSAEAGYKVMRIERAAFDGLYMASDGVYDQTGGKRGHGYGKRRFKESIVAAGGKAFEEQKAHMLQSLYDYQGSHPRRDDITIVGFRSAQAES